MSFTIHGIGVSGGIAIGHAQLVSHAQLEVAHYDISKARIAQEKAKNGLPVRDLAREQKHLRALTARGARKGLKNAALIKKVMQTIFAESRAKQTAIIQKSKRIAQSRKPRPR